MRHALLAMIALMILIPLGLSASEPSYCRFPNCAQSGKRVYNVADYGTVPDDGNPDNVALQAAVDAANDAGGGTVQVPCGTYTSGSADSFWADALIRIDPDYANISIVAEAPGCVTFEPHDNVTDGIALMAICSNAGTCGDPPAVGTSLPENISVKGIRFYDDDPAAHAGASEESHGIIIHCKECTFDDLAGDMIADEFLDVGRYSDGIYINRAKCRGIGSGENNAASCVNIQGAINIRVNDTTCTDGPGSTLTYSESDCVRVEGFTGSPALSTPIIRDVEISGSSIHDFSGAAGIVVNASQREIRGILIEKNYIDFAYDEALDTDGLPPDLELDHDPGGSGVLFALIRADAGGSFVTDGFEVGEYAWVDGFTGSATPANGVFEITAVTATTLTMDDGGGKVTADVASATGPAVRTIKYVASPQNDGEGAILLLSTYQKHGVRITNNQLYGVVYLTNADGAFIQGNEIGAAGSEGIYSGSTNSAVKIVDNTIRNTARSGILSSGPNAIIGRNLFQNIGTKYSATESSKGMGVNMNLAAVVDSTVETNVFDGPHPNAGFAIYGSNATSLQLRGNVISDYPYAAIQTGGEGIITENKISGGTSASREAINLVSAYSGIVGMNFVDMNAKAGEAIHGDASGNANITASLNVIQNSGATNSIDFGNSNGTYVDVFGNITEDNINAQGTGCYCSDNDAKGGTVTCTTAASVANR